jgi:LEA14-like dessication related protein
MHSPLPSRHLVAAVTVFTVLLVAEACGGGRTQPPPPPPVPFDQPSVSIRDVHFRGAGFLGTELELALHVYNPNDYALQAPRVHYRVLVADAEIANGMTDLDVTVPPNDSAKIMLPASMSYDGAKAAARAMLEHGAAQYRVLGRIIVGTPYGRLSFPYDRIGHFSPPMLAHPR